MHIENDIESICCSLKPTLGSMNYNVYNSLYSIGLYSIV